MQLTRERAITLHRRMWRWIGLKTLREKRCVEKHEWFNKFELEWIKSLCYCCEYAQQIADNSSLSCKACPVDWGVRTCTAPGRGLYDLWCDAVKDRDWQEAGKLALQIAELPEREEI